MIAVVASALLFALASPQPAAAADVRRGRSVFIPASETIHNDLIVAGPSVRVDGTVDGDLIAFTRDLTVTGGQVTVLAPMLGKTLVEPLPPIHLTDLGGADGATPAQIGAQVLNIIADKAVIAGAAALTKQLGGGVVPAQAGGLLHGLFGN